MILYRGTPVPEEALRPREYACVFFSPKFDYAADYALGKQHPHGFERNVRETGFVQEYRFQKQKLLDMAHRRTHDLMQEFTGVRVPRPPKGQMYSIAAKLFWNPIPEWIGILSSHGYTGVSVAGEDVCIFDVSKAELIARWRVWVDQDGQGRRERVE